MAVKALEAAYRVKWPKAVAKITEHRQPSAVVTGWLAGRASGSTSTPGHPPAPSVPPAPNDSLLRPAARRVDVPGGHWVVNAPRPDMLALARKGRAFRSLDTLIVKQGGENVLHGSVLTRPPSGPGPPTPTRRSPRSRSRRFANPLRSSQFSHRVATVAESAGRT